MGSAPESGLVPVTHGEKKPRRKIDLYINKFESSKEFDNLTSGSKEDESYSEISNDNFSQEVNVLHVHPSEEKFTLNLSRNNEESNKSQFSYDSSTIQEDEDLGFEASSVISHTAPEKFQNCDTLAVMNKEVEKLSEGQKDKVIINKLLEEVDESNVHSSTEHNTPYTEFE